MKKFAGLILIFISSFVLYAQNSSTAANYRTAQRCLQLSEKYILNGDFKGALNQADMGIAYDDSISDLFYVKAVSQSHLEYKRCDILDTISAAFLRNNWINYNETNARILYADLLSETGRYGESLAIIDGSPMIYSSDAEFIRIKNYYRLGTEDDIYQARKRFSSVRKVYPSDERFPAIFFLFEKMFMLEAENKGAEYKIEPIVQSNADAYIAKIPDYSKADIEMEIAALMFAYGEQQERLIKAVGEKSMDSQMFALVALKKGIISEDRAYNLFFENHSEFNLREVINFITLLKDEEVRNLVRDYLNAFTGTLKIDGDMDLNPELIVKYERGRPSYISYDANNDQVNELYSVCDFGVPQSLNFTSSHIDLFYESYPAVKKIVNNNNQMVFYFLDDDYKYTPFNIQSDPDIYLYGIEFFIPYVNNGSVFYDQNKILQYASSVEIPVQERVGAKAVYSYFGGHPVFVNFMERNYNYAYCSMEGGLPYKRYVDYDRDGSFETIETYDLSYSEMVDSDAIFGDIPDCKHLILKKLQIDRNSDTNYEYQEEYLDEFGIISSWDNNSDGIWDYQYIRYPDSYGEDGTVVEESVFYEESGIAYVTVKDINSVPVSLKYYNTEMQVVKGYADGYYWLETAPSKEIEDEIINQIKTKLVNGVVTLFTAADNRFSVIKIDSKIFCHQLPESLIRDEESNIGDSE